MNCPDCNNEDTSVIDSRIADNGTSVRRRRECEACGHRFTTYERTARPPLIVSKSNGSSEQFDRSKILRGLMIATTKRNVALNTLENLIDDIEKELIDTNTRQITSKKLGDMVLERLLEVDELAYIRFASVYKDFQSIGEFSQALSGIDSK